MAADLTRRSVARSGGIKQSLIRIWSERTRISPIHLDYGWVDERATPAPEADVWELYLNSFQIPLRILHEFDDGEKTRRAKMFALAFFPHAFLRYGGGEGSMTVPPLASITFCYVMNSPGNNLTWLLSSSFTQQCFRFEGIFSSCICPVFQALQQPIKRILQILLQIRFQKHHLSSEGMRVLLFSFP